MVGEVSVSGFQVGGPSSGDRPPYLANLLQITFSAPAYRATESQKMSAQSGRSTTFWPLNLAHLVREPFRLPWKPHAVAMTLFSFAARMRGERKGLMTSAGISQSVPELRSCVIFTVDGVLISWVDPVGHVVGIKWRKAWLHNKSLGLFV